MADLLSEQKKATICAAVTPTERAAIVAFCKARDLTPSKLARLALLKVVTGSLPLPPPAPSAPDSTSKPVHLRMPGIEKEAAKQRAAVEGCSMQAWMRRVIRAALTQSPVFTRDEEHALLASNRELGALGRNINQIARQLNLSLNEMDRVNAAQLAELEEQIKQHRTRVYALLNASWGRYGEGGKS